MVNKCKFKIQVTGEENSINIFLTRLEKNANPRFPHINSITEINRKTHQKTTTVTLQGECDWNILSCFTFSPKGYARLVNNFTCVENESKILHLDIDIKGQTPEDNTKEHIHCSNGKITEYTIKPIVNK